MRIGATALYLLLVSPLFGKDIYLSIAGSVGVFRTDTRIFNPSGTKDITVTASFLPVGQDNNSGAVTKQVMIPKRQMVVFNDIVTTLFAASGLGSIRLSSNDDFIATSRIYAQASNGTLGQFVPGLDVGAAKSKGILIQLKATGTTAVGTYRTNLGFVNPNATATVVTIHTFGSNNAEVGNPSVITIPPYSVMFPVTLDPASGNLTDGWVSYEAAQAIFGFASVVDNGTTDPTFMTSSEDTGSSVPPAGSSSKWYFSPILNFTLHPTPTAVTSGSKQLCYSPLTWTTTLQGDLTGTTYTFSLGLGRCKAGTGGCVSYTAIGEGRFQADIVLKRGASETILATSTFTSPGPYEVKTETVSGLDPAAQAGDTLMLRLRAIEGQPCVSESNGPGTDQFIEIPGLAQ